WTVLENTNEFIWYSQRDDWAHLYLYDLNSGSLKQQITKGDWRVLDIEKLDEENRVIYFTGSAIEDGNPYYSYLYCINFDGRDLKLLSPENGHHSFSFSDKEGLFVDTYSTPD